MQEQIQMSETCPPALEHTQCMTGSLIAKLAYGT